MKENNNAQSLVVMDVETYKKGEPILDATGKYFKLGVIYQANGVSFTFDKKEDMWNKLIELKEKCKKRGRKLVVYGHNIQYDFYNIAPLKDSHIKYYCINPFIASYYEDEEKEMTEEEFRRWEIYAINSGTRYRIIERVLGRVLIEREVETIKFLDSLTIFRMSAERLGNKLGVPKLEMPQRSLFKGELRKYCERDCKIVMDAMIMLRKKMSEDDVNIRNICSMSQVAIGYILNMLRKDEKSECLLYRNKAGKLTEWVHKTKFPEECHNAYRGGFVRAWQVGEFEDCCQIDINSLYPWSIIKMKLPDLRTERKINNPLSVYLKGDLMKKIGISKVLIKNNNDEMGLLPIRTKTKSYIPLKGKYIIGIWTNKEIKKAMENGYELINVEWSILWDEAEVNVMKKIYEELYKKRMDESNVFNLMIYKDVMNRCFDGETDVLTESGIRNIKDIKVGESVYSINPNTLKTELKEVKKVFKYNYKGEMIKIKAGGIDFLVTPNHRFLCKKRGSRGFGFIEAKDINDHLLPGFKEIEGKKREYIDLFDYIKDDEDLIINLKDNQKLKKRRSNELRYRGNKKYNYLVKKSEIKKIKEDIKEIKFYTPKAKGKGGGLPFKFKTEDLMKFIGIYLSEGSLYNKTSKTITISQMKSSKYWKEIKENIDSLNIPYKISEKGFFIYNNLIYRFLEESFKTGSSKKKFPNWIYKLDYKYLEYLYRGMMIGDGSIYINSNQMEKYTTINKSLAEAFQRICFHIGKKTRVVKERFENKELPNGKLIKNFKGYIYRIFIYKSKNKYIKKNRNQIGEVSGCLNKVYCLEVEDNHTLLAGRNGNLNWTGNSIGKMGQHKVSPEIFIDNIENTWKYIGENYKKLRGVSEDSYDIIIAKTPEKVERKKYYAPIIPALVTAEARCRMYDEYKKLDLKDILYSDSVTGEMDTLIKYKGEIERIKFKDIMWKEGMKTLCYRNGKTKWGNINRVIKHKVNKKGFRIFFSNKRFLEVTEDHSLIVKRKEEIINIKPKELLKEDIFIEIGEIKNKKKDEKDSLKIKKWELIGFAVDDGNMSKNKEGKRYYLNLSTGLDLEEFSERLINPLIKKGILRSKWISNTRKGDVLVNGLDFIRKVENIMYNNKDKNINEKIILNLPESYQKAFIRGMMSADGTIIKRGESNIIRYTSIREDYIRFLSYLLSINGIKNNYFIENNSNSFKGKDSKTYSIHLNIQDKIKFMKEIGFLFKRKNKIFNGKQNRIFNRKYKKIEEFNIKDYVYDLEVEDYHNFYANNILVHNTDSIIFKNKDNLKKFEIGRGLGEFKIEKDELDKSDLVNKNCLIWGTKSKSIGNNLAVSGAFKKGITLQDFKKGEVMIKRMIGIKGGDLNSVGIFNEEIKDLKKQMEEFLREKEEMDKLKIYIDERIEDVSFFRNDLSVIQGGF